MPFTFNARDGLFNRPGTSVEARNGVAAVSTEQVLSRVDERVLSDTEVADRLGVSRFTVRAWRHKGQGPRFMKMGRAVRYRPEDVEAFKETALVDPAAQ